jgi:hypothetical protein
MKASINNVTGLLIESSSDSHDETLIANALAQGFTDVEIRIVTDNELAALIQARDISTSAGHRAFLQKQINDLESEQLLPRVTREALLGIAVIQASLQGVTEPELYAVNIAYHKTKDFDNVIAALRAQMEAIV